MGICFLFGEVVKKCLVDRKMREQRGMRNLSLWLFFFFLWLLEFGVLKVVMISWWGIGLVRKCRESK